MSFPSKAIFALALLLALICLSGCGGQGATQSYQGIYVADIPVGTGTSILVLSSNSVGQLGVTLTSSSAATSGFSGGGTLDADGTVIVSATRADGSSISVQGALSPLGFTGSISGSVTANNITATQILSNANNPPFTGTFTGSVAGSTSSGTGTLAVSNPIVISLTMTGSIQASLNGSIASSGLFTMTGTYVLNGTTHGVTASGVAVPGVASGTATGYASIVDVNTNATIDRISFTLTS